MSMQKLKIGVVSAVLICAPAVTSAQIYGPYTDPARMTFATQGCNEGKWEEKGYWSFKDCYDAYYKAYPNDPNPGPE